VGGRWPPPDPDPYDRDPYRRRDPFRRNRQAQRAAFPELDRPKELTIAQRSTLVLIQEGDDEGSVRGIHTDGRRRPLPGGRGEMRGQWEEGDLVVESWGNDGLQLVEIYALSPDPRELTVTVEIVAPGLPPLTVRSVYLPTPSSQ
jgi:hypothetical protein